MTTTPTHIPQGTVSARIQSFQKNLSHLDNLPRINDRSNRVRTHLCSRDRPDTDTILPHTSTPILADPDESSSELEDPVIYTGPFPTPNSTRPASSLTKQYEELKRPGSQSLLLKMFDGPSQLAAVRSRLRSVTEQEESLQSDSEGKESVMSELDNLLQNAIDQQQVSSKNVHDSLHDGPRTSEDMLLRLSTPPRPHSPKHIAVEGSANKVLAVVSPHKHFGDQQPFRSTPVDSETDTRLLQVFGQSQSAERKQVLGQNDRDISRPTVPSAETLQRLLSSRSSNASTIRYLPPKMPIFSRYRSNSLGKVGSFAPSEGGDRVFRQPIVHEDMHRSRLSSPSPSHAGSTIDSHSRHLLPLMLPRIAEGRDFDHQADDQVNSMKDFSAYSQSVPKERQPRAMSSLEQRPSSRGSQFMTSSHNVQNFAQGNSYEAQALKQPEKRPSVIESKIENLLAAAKKHDIEAQEKARWTSKPNKVREGILKENIRRPFDIGSKNLPPFHAPIDEQATLLHNEKMGSSPSKHFRPHSQTTPSPVRGSHTRSNTSHEVPTRPESQLIKDRLSPRGSGYTFEQRFAISPSRSQSRMVNNAVHVSVELRRSPDRNMRNDQMLLVRASVEPEDTEEATIPL